MKLFLMNCDAEQHERDVSGGTKEIIPWTFHGVSKGKFSHLSQGWSQRFVPQVLCVINVYICICGGCHRIVCAFHWRQLMWKIIVKFVSYLENIYAHTTHTHIQFINNSLLSGFTIFVTDKAFNNIAYVP